MLTSITPLGERGRGHRWGITSSWLIAGHVVGGLALGAALAAIGSIIRVFGVEPGDSTAVAIIGVTVVLGAIHDLVGRPLPGRRQVDERWLTAYRGWVYGGGFGVQLGFGLVTVVNTALLAAVLVAGVVVSVPSALALGGVYGAVRGVAATTNGWVRSVSDLRRLHRWIDRAERPARWATASIGAASAIAAVVLT